MTLDPRTPATFTDPDALAEDVFGAVKGFLMTAATPALPRSTRTVPKFATVTAVVAIPAFVLAPLLFSAPAEFPEPTSAQLPLFIALTAFESIAMGLAVAVLLFGRSWFHKLFSSPGRVRAAQLSLVWFLGNWWIHDNLHIVNGVNLGGLLAIEYAFHVTLMVAGAALLWALAGEARAQGSKPGKGAAPAES